MDQLDIPTTALSIDSIFLCWDRHLYCQIVTNHSHIPLQIYENYTSLHRNVTVSCNWPFRNVFVRTQMRVFLDRYVTLRAVWSGTKNKARWDILAVVVFLRPKPHLRLHKVEVGFLTQRWNFISSSRHNRGRHLLSWSAVPLMSFPNCLVFWQFHFHLQKHWQIIWSPSTKNDSWPDPSPNLHSSIDSCQSIHSCFSRSLIWSRWFFRRCFVFSIRAAFSKKQSQKLLCYEHPSDNHDLHFAFPKGLFTTFFTVLTRTFYVTRTLINAHSFIHVTFCTSRTYSEYFERKDETQESETLYPV